METHTGDTKPFDGEEKSKESERLEFDVWFKINCNLGKQVFVEKCLQLLRSSKTPWSGSWKWIMRKHKNICEHQHFYSGYAYANFDTRQEA